jgi:phage tail sheath protein FI
LDLLAKPFLFEQNDLQTQSAFQVTLERFLSGLVGLQALADFAVVCDASNNTPERVDANELWADILIQPIKAIEFIYLPVRILNTGATMTTAGTSSSSSS